MQHLQRSQTVGHKSDWGGTRNRESIYIAKYVNENFLGSN